MSKAMKKELNIPPSLRSVANLMACISLLEEKISGEKDEEYQANIQPVAMGLFRLVVMGEVKKGKSSFINALCGIEGLVPVNEEVATSTIFKIHHGPALKYTVFFEPEAAKSPLEIPKTELADFGTETGNPNNVKQVDFIGVQAPAPFLQGGLIIVDTPGVGGLFKKHREITFRYAPRADAVFFVTDSVESPIGADEVSFLKELRRVTPLIYFIQTKSARVETASGNAMMDNNISILTKKVEIPQSDIRYFQLDSKLKAGADKSRDMEDLKDSGFPPVLSYLQNILKPARDRNIATMGLRRATTKLADIKAAVVRERSVLDADTAEKQAYLKDQIQEAEGKLHIWNTETRPQLIKEFQAEAAAIQNDLTRMISDKLRSGGEIAEEAGNALNSLRGIEPEQIYLAAEELAAATRGAASQVMVDVSTELESRFIRLIEALAVKAGSGIPSTALVACDDDSTKIGLKIADSHLHQLIEKGKEGRLFEKARTGLYGGMAGVAIASVAGGIIGSVVPVVGTIIGSTVGMMIAAWWGGAQACELVRSKEASAAIQQVHAFIERDLASIQSQVQMGINKVFTDLRLKAEDVLSEMAKRTMSQLTNARKSLQERARATAQEIALARQKTESTESAVAALAKEISAMEKAMA